MLSHTQYPGDRNFQSEHPYQTRMHPDAYALVHDSGRDHANCQPRKTLEHSVDTDGSPR